jgi:hypothetical protein
MNVKVITAHPLNQKISCDRRLGVHDLMNSALCHRASLTGQEEDLLVRIPHSNGHPAGKAEHIVGHLTMRVQGSDFIRSQFNNSGAGILGLEYYFFADRHIDSFQKIAANNNAPAIPAMDFMTAAYP